MYIKKICIEIQIKDFFKKYLARGKLAWGMGWEEKFTLYLLKFWVSDLQKFTAYLKIEEGKIKETINLKKTPAALNFVIPMIKAPEKFLRWLTADKDNEHTN